MTFNVGDGISLIKMKTLREDKNYEKCLEHRNRHLSRVMKKKSLTLSHRKGRLSTKKWQLEQVSIKCVKRKCRTILNMSQNCQSIILYLCKLEFKN